MTFVGLNGFGRIGKCIFLLLLNNDNIHVKAINAPDFDIAKLESYLKNDSVHKYQKDFEIEIVDNDSFLINGHLIHLLRDRNAENLSWKKYGIEILIDASGVYLTKEKAQKHDVERIIMSAPAKDDTPLFVYGANHNSYNDEKIISNASCTTNSIAPVLRHLEENYGIVQANFTTIHASTASQKVVDTAHSKSRTNRSIFNNIIPHSTGASSSIGKVLPKLDGKIKGTSVRVPVNNVSLIDLNVELTKETTLTSILELMDQDGYLHLCKDNLVSSDYISTTCPSIIDASASMELGKNQFKIMIWYDNEWSYSQQLIRMAEVMDSYQIKNPRFIENTVFQGKKVVVRLDLNLPIVDGKVTSDFRLQSTFSTLQYILNQNPKRVIIMSHMGRPKGPEEDKSLAIIHPLLEKMLTKTVGFLSQGLSLGTLETLEKEEHTIYLLENLRFHKEETHYKQYDINNEPVFVMQQLGNMYVNDAFGCMHRNHLSICGMGHCEMAYGYLVQKELEALNLITKNPYDQKILAIIGGGKMDDKMELLKNMCKKVDTIYVCGGNINSILKNDMSSYMHEIQQHKAKIILMEDGLASSSVSATPTLKNNDELDMDENFLDIGIQSLQTLQALIHEHDIIFWNGTLGVVEDAKFKKGSEFLVKALIQERIQHPKKKVIIGGGDTGGFANHYEHNFSHISTGGGASIEYITFDTLVGLDIFNTT
jgi:glyceraldehyde 3-phosphate dehydrogenase